MRNAQAFKSINKAALVAMIIFLLITFHSKILFAYGGYSEFKIEENPSSAQLQSHRQNQEYPGPDDFVSIDKEPVVKYSPEPKYPEKAIKDEIEGTVWVKALVDKEGNVQKAVIIKESVENAGFSESALKNAKLRKYKPAELDGKPVAVWIAYKVEYKLK